MTDELGLFNGGRSDQGQYRSARGRPPRRRRTRKRITVWASVLIVVALIAGGVWFGLTQILGIEFGGYDDFSGAGDSDIIIEVPSGASTGGIAAVLQEKGVVASTKAFTKAAEENTRVRGIQPGFYQMRTKVSGKDAVAKILAADSRKGKLEIRAGWQLHDISKLDGSVEPGIIKRLSTASCAELNGKSTCVPVEELRKVAETADLAALGAADWAAAAAAKVEPARRVEGLVLPAVYDVKPGSTAQELWLKLISESRLQLETLGMPKVAGDTGFTPYQVLTMASLIEREAIQKDFDKVSRVTYNRLAKGMKLEYDSTVNYVLDRPAIRTKPEDRARAGAYNTYANVGLTPGPISAPSKEAVNAALKPAVGTWLFFVRCQKDGTSCFAETNQQHQQNVKLAQDNDAY